MNNGITYVCKVYLKSGVIVEDEIVFDKGVDMEYAEECMGNFKNSIKEELSGNNNFQFTFGETIFRGSEIAAITIRQKQYCMGE